MENLTCFKAYDIRGQIGVNIDENVAYRIGRATAQHFAARSVVVGFDARETSPCFAAAASEAIMDAGANVFSIGLAGTEEMYWAVTQFAACAGIEITASHNPINYNGMKIVKAGSRPLDEKLDFQVIRDIAETMNWSVNPKKGAIRDRSVEARASYVDRVLRFVDPRALKPLKIVINSGNGAAGPTFDAIADRLFELGVPLEFIRVHHNPDFTFPNGIPNPLLSKNHSATANMVKAVGADFAVAFDGDFDRCFFFDEFGAFVPSEYVVGLLASVFLEKEVGARIVHDPRVIWNTQDIVCSKGGRAIQSKTGHAFMKQMMRDYEAAYGGEISAHHYFRDFAYCDSGMIPWLVIAELVSRSEKSLGNLVKNRIERFPSSGEINFMVNDPVSALEQVLAAYRDNAHAVDDTDGISLTFTDWRFNLRCSNTEPLVRLNIETKAGAHQIDDRINMIAEIIGGTKV
jgi:phosphomannomutase